MKSVNDGIKKLNRAVSESINSCNDDVLNIGNDISALN